MGNIDTRVIFVAFTGQNHKVTVVFPEDFENFSHRAGLNAAGCGQFGKLRRASHTPVAEIGIGQAFENTFGYCRIDPGRCAVRVLLK